MVLITGTYMALDREGQPQLFPTWYVPASIRQVYWEVGEILPKTVPPGPDNPLGKYAMRLGGTSYLIHGTNAPDTIGWRSTSGCIRLYPRDIRELYRMVPVGTPVRVVNQVHKVGWSGNRLYLESHLPLREFDDLEKAERTTIFNKVKQLAAARHYDVDWGAAKTTASRMNGIPRAL